MESLDLMFSCQYDHLVCRVCWNIFTDPSVLPCGHSFCGECVESPSSDKCPDCGEEFSEIEIVKNVALAAIANRAKMMKSRKRRLEDADSPDAKRALRTPFELRWSIGPQDSEDRDLNGSTIMRWWLQDNTVEWHFTMVVVAGWDMFISILQKASPTPGYERIVLCDRMATVSFKSGKPLKLFRLDQSQLVNALADKRLEKGTAKPKNLVVVDHCPRLDKTTVFDKVIFSDPAYPSIDLKAFKSELCERADSCIRTGGILGSRMSNNPAWRARSSLTEATFCEVKSGVLSLNDDKNLCRIIVGNDKFFTLDSLSSLLSDVL